jgi:hypothetical protein
VEMKPHGKLLGRNPPHNTPYQNLVMVLNGQWLGCHPFGGVLYLWSSHP